MYMIVRTKANSARRTNPTSNPKLYFNKAEAIKDAQELASQHTDQVFWVVKLSLEEGWHGVTTAKRASRLAHTPLGFTIQEDL